MRPNIHAIMLNWNQLNDTVDCIASLKESSMPVHIIVLDQSSEDGSGVVLRNMYRDDAQVTVVLNDQNYGFAEGMNIGIRHALAMGAEMVLLINNDTIVHRDCVALLVQALESNIQVGAAGPSILYHSQPDKLWATGGRFSLLKMGVIMLAKNKYLREINDKIASVTFLTGCALLLPASTIARVGLLDSTYFFYVEDIDYSLRLRQAGLQLAYVPSAKVWHKVFDIAENRTSPYVLYHIGRSYVMMLRKRFPPVLRWYGIALQVFLFTPFRIFQIIKGGNGWDSIRAWMRGLYHGVMTRIPHHVPNSPRSGTDAK